MKVTADQKSCVCWAPRQHENDCPYTRFLAEDKESGFLNILGSMWDLHKRFATKFVREYFLGA